MNAIDWDEGGADLHSWESQWASIAEDADFEPDAALSQYAVSSSGCSRPTGTQCAMPWLAMEKSARS